MSFRHTLPSSTWSSIIIKLITSHNHSFPGTPFLPCFPNFFIGVHINHRKASFRTLPRQQLASPQSWKALEGESRAWMIGKQKTESAWKTEKKFNEKHVWITHRGVVWRFVKTNLINWRLIDFFVLDKWLINGKSFQTSFYSFVDSV